MAVDARRMAGVAVVGLLALVPVTACGEGASDSQVASDSTPSLVPAGQIDQPVALKKGWEGVRSQVALYECPVQAGQITASGTVRNTADEARDIAILISWNRPDSTDTVLQLGVTKTDVPAGGTAEWSVSGDLPVDAGPCIINARSGHVRAGPGAPSPTSSSSSHSSGG